MRKLNSSLLTAHSSFSPTRLPYPRNHPGQCQIPEANPADAELPQIRARAPAALAAVVLPHAELRLALRLFHHGLTSHSTPSMSSGDCKANRIQNSVLFAVKHLPPAACHLHGTASPALATTQRPDRHAACWSRT